jgi:hypothetical protein
VPRRLFASLLPPHALPKLRSLYCDKSLHSGRRAWARVPVRPQRPLAADRDETKEPLFDYAKLARRRYREVMRVGPEGLVLGFPQLVGVGEDVAGLGAAVARFRCRGRAAGPARQRFVRRSRPVQVTPDTLCATADFEVPGCVRACACVSVWVRNVCWCVYGWALFLYLSDPPLRASPAHTRYIAYLLA